jgi:hypothetical protein
VSDSPKESTLAYPFDPKVDVPEENTGNPYI